MSTDINTLNHVAIGGGLTVGNIGYGAMQLTGPKVWGEYPDHHQGVELLRQVADAGVTFIDTADVYGPHANEELIREALYPYPDDLVIATKGGFVRGGPEYSDMSAVGNKYYLRQSAYMSMRRLGLDHIDLYYLHTPTMTDAPFEEVIETLAGMRQDGLIRHVGLSNVSAEPAPHGADDHGHRRRDRPLQRCGPARRGGARIGGRAHASRSRPGILARYPAVRTVRRSTWLSTRSPPSTTRPRSR